MGGEKGGKQIWTKEQEEYLEELYSQTASMSTIVVKMKEFSGIERSRGAIYAKLNKLGLREYDSRYTGSYGKLHAIWAQMRYRCSNQNAKNYHNYGGRGIAVCDDWNDYITFKEWAISNGYDEKAERGQCTLDRIDVDGNYCPENCRFITIESQERNKRNNRYVTIDGKRQSVAEWCEELDRNYNTVFTRIKRNWDEVDAILTPTPTGYIPYQDRRNK